LLPNNVGSFESLPTLVGGKMKARVYLETSVISYLTARPSRNVVAAGHQQVTLAWWERRRHDFEVVASQLVAKEVRFGNPEAAMRRLAILEEVLLLNVTEAANELAVAIVRGGLLPRAAFPDALHIATATVHEIDYLLTWNCAHIANAEILPRVAAICESHGLSLPFICTPEELLGEPQ
jgi:predicted nucleic acid-binding protein